MKRTIKKETTTETNVSQRQVWYDGYQDGQYIKTFHDVCDAVDWRDGITN